MQYKSAQPKVSIIIPCYNQAEFVSEALQSAINQTYKNTEIICINDASDDDSAKIMNDFAARFNNIIFLNSNINIGVCAARNLGIENALGEYILPLDADDIIEPTYIEKAVKILNENQDIAIVYCLAKIFGKENKIWKLPPFNKDEILFKNLIFNCALFRKKDFINAGKYKEYMKNGLEDWDLWLSFIEQGKDAYRIDEYLFNYRINENNSRNDIALNSIDILRANIIKNHLNLFLKNKEFLKRVFNPPKAKYKKLYKILFWVAIVEFILILIFVLWRF